MRIPQPPNLTLPYQASEVKYNNAITLGHRVLHDSYSRRLEARRTLCELTPLPRLANSMVSTVLPAWVGMGCDDNVPEAHNNIATAVTS